MLAAYAYLIYRLLTFDDYSSFAAVFLRADFLQWTALLGCVLLLPLNFFCEASKWRQLLSELHPISYREAIRQVLYGQMAAFITPYRLGDIPARVLRLRKPEYSKQAFVMGLYGGLIQTVVIVVCGFFPAILFLRHTSLPYLPQIALVAALVLALFGALQYKNLPRSIRLSGRQLLITFSWSVARYGCWLVQFALALMWAGQSISFANLCVALPAYYLFVTLTPNIPVADAGIRGSWAVFILGFYGSDAPTAALVAVAIWFINTLLPVALYFPWTKLIALREPNERHNRD